MCNGDKNSGETNKIRVTDMIGGGQKKDRLTISRNIRSKL